MSFINEYVSYFENLARVHEDILHKDGEKHFYRLEPEEYLVGLTSEMNYPAIVLEAYDCSFQDKESNNILKNINGAFAILKHLENEQDIDGIHEIWDECEKIGTDFLIRIYNEKFTRQNIVIKLDMNSVTMAPVANGPGRVYGMRFTYTLMVRQTHLVEPSKWTDND
jgi:hypothetical protein